MEVITLEIQKVILEKLNLIGIHGMQYDHHLELIKKIFYWNYTYNANKLTTLHATSQFCKMRSKTKLLSMSSNME
jgi:hypothetical protein